MKEQAIELAKEIITNKSDISSIWSGFERHSLRINFHNKSSVVLEKNSPKDVVIYHDDVCTNSFYKKYFHTEIKQRTYKPNWWTKEKTEYTFTDHYQPGYSFDFFYEVMVLLRQYQKYVETKQVETLLNDFDECLKTNK